MQGMCVGCVCVCRECVCVSFIAAAREINRWQVFCFVAATAAAALAAATGRQFLFACLIVLTSFYTLFVLLFLLLF